MATKSLSGIFFREKSSNNNSKKKVYVEIKATKKEIKMIAT